MDKKLNGFNNGRDTTDGVGGKPGLNGKEFTITFSEDVYKKEDVITMKENEKLYRFTEWRSTSNCKEYFLKENELQDKHKNLLLGQLITDYERLPKDRLDKFKEYINQQKEKEIQLYKTIITEILEKEKGSVLLMDVNLIPNIKDFNTEEFLKVSKNQGISWVKSEPSLEEAINVLQKHFAPKGDVNKLQSQMLNSKKLEILKSIANAGGIDWDEVIENDRIISLKLKMLIK
jgi:hypothetical protein